MNNSTTLGSFTPHPPDAAGVLSWVHIGDLHMRAAGQQNDVDLQAIVTEVNAAFAGSISFVFLPGDNADHGDAAAYAVVRQALDGLQAPWCAIVGDHDVEQKSFDNFKASLAEKTYYAFAVGHVRFLALNAFDAPEPPSFAVLPEQLRWIEEELRAATNAGEEKVLLLHCYPSDLKQGREELIGLMATYEVKLVEMGHTHYNEISHDGRTIYAATRSTGQIEEGPVGFSVSSIDEGVVSWRFLELGKLPAIIITSPADERLMADTWTAITSEVKELQVKAKAWGQTEVIHIQASFGEQNAWMHRVPGSNVWCATLPCDGISSGVHPLRVSALDGEGRAATDEIRVFVGAEKSSRARAERDQDNALEAWPDHGLLGTQLGPNKNGRKW